VAGGDRMKKLLMLSLILTLLPFNAMAAEQCSVKICIKVFTDPTTGKVVIQAHQNRAGSTPKPVVHRTPNPHPTRTWSPRPYTPRPYTPRPKPKVVTAISLADQLTQLIPMREIYYQPASKTLAQVPVNFWTTTSPTFNTSVVILGVPVSVFLTPTFIWDFGDGTTLSTTELGAPYPNGKISHTYKTTGNFTASLTVSWTGSWLADKLLYPVIGGAIVQKMQVTIPVSPAPTKYTH
jgi:PKD domain